MPSWQAYSYTRVSVAGHGYSPDQDATQAVASSTVKAYSSSSWLVRGEALGDAQVLGGAEEVEPGSGFEVLGLHHQGIAVPTAHGIPHPLAHFRVVLAA